MTTDEMVTAIKTAVNDNPNPEEVLRKVGWSEEEVKSFFDATEEVFATHPGGVFIAVGIAMGIYLESVHSMAATLDA
jgi:hypothetical protein